MANNNKKIQNINGEDNDYLKLKKMRVQENQQRLRNLGVKNIVNSSTSLAQRHQVKKKAVKQNTLDGDADYIPDPSDDSEEDCQQVARSVVSKKQLHRQYISPMSINRVAKQVKLHRVVAPNVSQKVPSTSNATKPNKQLPTVTVSEISKGKKGGAETSADLFDEDNEILQGNRVDIEVDDVDQHDEYENVGNMIHTNNPHETQIADHDFSEDEDNITKQLQCTDKQKASNFVTKSNRKHKRKRLHITSIVSNERIENHVDDDHVEDNVDDHVEDNVDDHQIFETQAHQSGEIQGAPKNARGYTQKAEIWKMDTTQRIVVTFNKFGIPIGDEGNELIQFLGTLVRMPEHVSIEYSDWRKVPIQKKEDMYSLVKFKFVIHPNETSGIKKWILHSMGRKWRAWKGSLKDRAYDPSLTVAEIVSQQVKNDNRLNQAQFKELVTRWFTPEFQETCAAKRSSRSKMKEPHVSGTKSFARLSHEMATENNGVHPTRGEMYVKTRTRKNGSIVDDKVAHVVASLKDIANESTITPGDPNDFTIDEYSKVKGPEKRGYIRLVGRIPAEKSNGASSTDSQTIDQLTSVVNAMAVIIQKHIPNANLSSVLGNMNIQVPGVGSLVNNNSSSVNEMSSSRIPNDNVYVARERVRKRETGTGTGTGNGKTQKIKKRGRYHEKL